MFIGHEKTGWRSAVIYTFVEQVRRHGKGPFAYFEWVIGKLIHDPAEEELPGLLPAAWLKAQGEPAMADDRGVALEREPRDLSRKCERCSVERLPPYALFDLRNEVSVVPTVSRSFSVA